MTHWIHCRPSTHAPLPLSTVGAIYTSLGFALACLSRRRPMVAVQVIAGDVDATLVRFLRARKGKVSDAAKMLKGEPAPRVLCCALQ